MENKRNNTGLRFVLQSPRQGNAGCLLWQDERLPALIDWKDPVVIYGLAHTIKYARLTQRQASSVRAQGADVQGQRYFVQLALEGVPYHKPKHQIGSDTVGLDLPSLYARHRAARRLPAPGDASRPSWPPMPRRSGGCSARWSESFVPTTRTTMMSAGASSDVAKGASLGSRACGRLSTWRSKATRAETRRSPQSLHGRLVHEIVAVGTTIITEKIAYRAWQKQFGRSVGLRAPGMFIELLRREPQHSRAAP